ncbi:MAG: hypothetical protein ACKJSK_18765 [Roseibacillus sp.]
MRTPCRSAARRHGCWKKNGFARIGAVEDPEDGTVWRWELKT